MLAKNPELLTISTDYFTAMLRHWCQFSTGRLQRAT